MSIQPKRRCGLKKIRKNRRIRARPSNVRRPKVGRAESTGVPDAITGADLLLVGRPDFKSVRRH